MTGIHKLPYEITVVRLFTGERIHIMTLEEGIAVMVHGSQGSIAGTHLLG